MRAQHAQLLYSIFIYFLTVNLINLAFTHLNNDELTFKSFKLNLSLVGAIRLYRSTPY